MFRNVMIILVHAVVILFVWFFLSMVLSSETISELSKLIVYSIFVVVGLIGSLSAWACIKEDD